MIAYKSFSERVSTITPTVLGYRLLPYSLGMAINLKEANSKFINGQYNGFLDINNIFNALITDESLAGEFVFAVLCCSNTYDEFKDECGSGNIMDTVKQLITEIKYMNINLLFEIHSFAHYLNNGTNGIPEYNVKEVKEHSDNPFDYEETVISSLIENTSYTRNECYNLSVNETLSAYLVLAHKNGVIEITSQDTIEMMNQMKGNK